MIPLGILASAGAAAPAGAFELIQTQVISGDSTSSVTFSNLSGATGYRHLQIRASVAGTKTSNLPDLTMRFNGATTGYWDHTLRGDGSSVISGSVVTTATLYLGTMARTNVDSPSFAGHIIDIIDAFSTSKNKTIRFLGGHRFETQFIQLKSGLWQNTSAINSITLAPDLANFSNGSRFSLYGIKG